MVFWGQGTGPSRARFWHGGASVNRPLAWVSASFITGLFLAAQGLTPGFGVPLVACFAALTFMGPLRRWRRSRTASVACAFLGAGALLWHARHLDPPGDPLSRHVASHDARDCTLEGRVRGTAVQLPHATRTHFILDAERLIVDGNSQPMAGGVVVTWREPGAPVFPGEHIRVRGPLSICLGRVNPGVMDVEDHYRRNGVHSGLRIRGPDAVVRGAAPPWWAPRYWAARVRAFEADRLIQSVPASALPLALTIWLGDRQLLKPDDYHSYVASGTAHILAVSGVHVGVVYLSVTALLGMFIRDRRAKAIAVMGAVLAFAVVAGARTSSLRAASMVCLYLCADLFERDRDVPTALSVSALAFTLWNPDLLFDPGFQLSFLSVASILVFTAAVGARREGREGAPRNVLGHAAAKTLAVQVLPLPVAVKCFHVLPLAAPLANMLVLPLLTVALWLCFATALVGAVWVDAAALFGHALVPVAFAIRSIAEIVADTRWSHFVLTSPAWPAAVLYWGAAGLCALGLAASRHRGSLFAGAVGLLLLAIGLWQPLWPQTEVVFLDVGHGDAVFARSPEGHTLLVDGGDRGPYINMGERVVAPFLWANGVRRLDYVLLTHTDQDHAGGLPTVLEHFDVGCVIMGPACPENELEQEILAQCERRSIPVRRVRRGDPLPFGACALDVLHPPEPWPCRDPANDQSVVVRLSCLGTRLLLTGDVEARAEDALAASGCAADIMKSPHHGSRTSSTHAFLGAVAPSHVVVSTGLTWGRTAADPEVIERYRDRGATVWRTDELGAIRVTWPEGRAVIEGERFRRGYPVPSVDDPGAANLTPPARTGTPSPGL
jgi:competence protein ComEC